MTLADSVDSPEPTFDDWLRTWITEARSLTEFVDQAFAEKYPNARPGAAFPFGTVSRLLIGTTPLYLSGLACLADASTSVGAYSMLRTLLETWAHLDFIVTGDAEESPVIGKDEPRIPAEEFVESAECRAIRIDLGIAELIMEMVNAATVALDAETQQAQAVKRLEEVTSIYKEHGCRGRARKYNRTMPSLEAMAARPEQGLGWVLDAYKASSMVIHGTSFDWSIRPGPQGEPTIADPPPSERAARFAHFVMAYRGMSLAALTAIEMADRIPVLDAIVDEMLDGNETLLRAVQGGFD